MNDQNSFERFLSERFDEVGPGRRLPDAAHHDLLARARGTRQRPQWLALIKEPPMRHSSHLAVGSPTIRVAAILAATLLISLVLTGAGIAGARLLAADGTIVVAQDGSGTVDSITEAVAMAEDGDTILVRPGTYVEAVTIDKDITLRGDGPRVEIVIEAPKTDPYTKRGSGGARRLHLTRSCSRTPMRRSPSSPSAASAHACSPTAARP